MLSGIALHGNLVEALLLLGGEVVEQDGALLGLLSPVLDDDAGAVDNLACVALTVDLAWISMLITAYGRPHEESRTPSCKTYRDQPTLPTAFHQGP